MKIWGGDRVGTGPRALEGRVRRRQYSEGRECTRANGRRLSDSRLRMCTGEVAKISIGDEYVGLAYDDAVTSNLQLSLWVFKNVPQRPATGRHDPGMAQPKPGLAP